MKDPLRQVPVTPLTKEEADVVARFRRDIERHRQRRNRLDEERQLQRALYRSTP